MHYDEEGANGEGSVRIQHQFKVEPNVVRSLEPGEAYLISRGRAMRAQILTAPELPRPCRGQSVRECGSRSGRRSSARHEPAPVLTSGVPLRSALSEEEVAALPF